MADKGKEILQEEKRLERAIDVVVLFTDPTHGVVLKNPLDGDDLHNIKYFVQISEDCQNDSCTCQSFYHGNTKTWLDEHGKCFECKHIKAMKKTRGWI